MKSNKKNIYNRNKTKKKQPKDLRNKRIYLRRGRTHKKGGECTGSGCTNNQGAANSSFSEKINQGAANSSFSEKMRNMTSSGSQKIYNAANDFKSNAIQKTLGVANTVKDYGDNSGKRVSNIASTIGSMGVSAAKKIGSLSYDAGKASIGVAKKIGEKAVYTGKTIKEDVINKDYSLFEGRPLYEKICGNISRLFIMNSHKFESTINVKIKELFESDTIKERFNNVFKEMVDEMVDDNIMKVRINNNIENKILDPVSEYIHNQLVGIDPNMTKERILTVLKNYPNSENNIMTPFGIGANIAKSTIEPLSSPNPFSNVPPMVNTVPFNPAPMQINNTPPMVNMVPFNTTPMQINNTPPRPMSTTLPFNPEYVPRPMSTTLPFNPEYVPRPMTTTVPFNPAYVPMNISSPAPMITTGPYIPRESDGIVQSTSSSIIK